MIETNIDFFFFFKSHEHFNLQTARSHRQQSEKFHNGNIIVLSMFFRHLKHFAMYPGEYDHHVPSALKLYVVKGKMLFLVGGVTATCSVLLFLRQIVTENKVISMPLLRDTDFISTFTNGHRTR